MRERTARPECLDCRGGRGTVAVLSSGGHQTVSEPAVFEMALTKRLVIIGTVAANAPYIEATGAPFCIMLTFHTMVLLVIVLTTATFSTTGQIPVDLAKAKEAGDKQNVPLVITLTADGGLFMNDQAVSEDGLQIILNPHPKESFVLVRADRATMLERFVHVVDEVRGLGFRQVSFEVVGS